MLLPRNKSNREAWQACENNDLTVEWLESLEAMG